MGRRNSPPHGNIVLAYLLFTGRHANAAEGGLLGELFADRNQRLSIITSDASLQVYRKIFQRIVPLQAYIDRSYLRPLFREGPENQSIWNFVSNRKDTTTSSTRAAVIFEKGLATRTILIRHPRDCTMRDLEHEKVILLGGPWINAWGQLFEDRLNFRVVPRASEMAGSEIVNNQPLSGEPKIFQTHEEGAYSVSYVRLAMLSELKEGGKAMLVGANSEEAIEAGSTFLVGDEAHSELLSRAHVNSVAALPSFEIVLEVRGLESTPHRVKIVAYRSVRE